MAKTLSEATLSTRTARAKLGEGTHWRGIDADLHLGYRRGKRSGKWLARWYIGVGKYRQEIFASADDAVEADGEQCLSFEQAKSAAARLLARRRIEDAASANGPVATVQSAIETYCIDRDARLAIQRGREGKKSDARLRLEKHVTGAGVAAIPLHELKESDLHLWRSGLPKNLSHATIERLINDLKAALNGEATRRRSHLPAEVFIVIKNGLAHREAGSPQARDDQALPDADIRRIVMAAHSVDERDEWDGDLARMVVVLAATGARFSQVVRMKVADVQFSQSRLMIPTSRKGRGTKAASHIAFRVGADVLASLRPAIAGRRGSETLLLRWRHKQVKRDGDRHPHWERDSRDAWLVAAELARPWQEIRKLAGLPADIIPYGLRHSSIVRQLRRGLPVRLVAALHDTSVKVIEAHYSASIVDAMDDLAASAVIDLLPATKDNVVRFGG